MFFSNPLRALLFTQSAGWGRLYWNSGDSVSVPVSRGCQDLRFVPKEEESHEIGETPPDQTQKKKPKMGTSQNPSWIFFFFLTHKWEKTNFAHKWEKNNFGHNLHPYKSPPKKLRT